MAFRDLFKKKVGGSFFGNIIRKVGDTFTGGMVSNFMPKPTVLDVAAQESKWDAKGVKYNKSAPQSSQRGIPEGSSGGMLLSTQIMPATEEGFLKKHWKKIAGAIGGLVLVFGIILGIKKRGGGSKSSR